MFYLLLQGYRRNAFFPKIGFFSSVVATGKYRTFLKKVLCTKTRVAWIQRRGQTSKILFSSLSSKDSDTDITEISSCLDLIELVRFLTKKRPKKKHNTCSRVLAAQYLKMRSLCSMHTTTDFCTRNSKKERRELTTSNIKGFLST